MRTLFSCVGMAVGLACATPSSAAIITYFGDTTAQPTYNRLLEDLSGLSAVGTAVRYETRTFSVTQTGDYVLTLASSGHDPFLFLYGPSFVPGTPLAGALGGNDDLLGLTTSGLSSTLTAGAIYTIVSTGFGNDDSGRYLATIAGPGDITTVASSAPAPSNILSVTGDTTGGATFNRPLEDLSGLSVVGTAVRYETVGFTVDVAGDYAFAATTTGFDPFVFLYQTSFNPAAPLTNALIANDDLLGLTSSGFNFTLATGTTYFAVVTSFGNDDFGRYEFHANGPGRIRPLTAAVPEPASWTMMIVGFGLAGLALRCRRAPASALAR